MHSTTTDAAAIAERFLAARRSAVGLSDYPGTMPRTLGDAYAVQDEAIGGWSKSVVGWKVGRILPPLSESLGADRLTGPIFRCERLEAGASAPNMPVFAEGFAAAEAEFLLRIRRAPPAGKRRFSLGEAADLIESVHVGIEIASSPLRTINDIGAIAVISDFGNNNGMVIGAEVPDWRESGFEDWTVVTMIDGVEAGRGQAALFPDGALGAARFLFELMAERRIELHPGQWISSGAVTGVHDVRPGQQIEARFGEGYSVRCALTAAQPE